MVITGVHLSRLIALALFGDDVQKMRPRAFADGPECALQFLYVVAIHRPDVLEPHIFKHGGVIHGPPHKRLAFCDHIFQRGSHHRNTVQKAAHIIFGVKIDCCGAQVGQISCQRSHIFGNGHFVVIQDHQQIVQAADVVHALVDHAAGKCAISDDGYHKARLFVNLFGPGHSDSQRKSSIAMARNEGIVYTFVRVRKAGNTVQLAQFAKLFPASGQQFVGIALVSHIEHDFIPGCFQHPVQRNRQFYRAQVRSKMSAGF